METRVECVKNRVYPNKTSIAHLNCTMQNQTRCFVLIKETVRVFHRHKPGYLYLVKKAQKTFKICPLALCYSILY